jgi:GntR family transcriptional regulator
VELDRDSDVPLYQQIANILRGRIEAGTYAPGAMIPAISTIIELTGCTHVTVRKGIDILEDEGLVVVRPGKGTYVRAQP